MKMTFFIVFHVFSAYVLCSSIIIMIVLVEKQSADYAAFTAGTFYRLMTL